MVNWWIWLNLQFKNNNFQFYFWPPSTKSSPLKRSFAHSESSSCFLMNFVMKPKWWFIHEWMQHMWRSSIGQFSQISLETVKELNNNESFYISGYFSSFLAPPSNPRENLANKFVFFSLRISFNKREGKYECFLVKFSQPKINWSPDSRPQTQGKT